MDICRPAYTSFTNVKLTNNGNATFVEYQINCFSGSSVVNSTPFLSLLVFYVMNTSGILSATSSSLFVIE